MELLIKLHPNFNKALYEFLKPKSKDYKLLGFLALLFKSLKIDLYLDVSNGDEFKEFVAGIPPRNY